MNPHAPTNPRPRYRSKRSCARGDFTAGALADLQGPKPPVALRLCKRHKWKITRSFLECRVCGLVEERPF